MTEGERPVFDNPTFEPGNALLLSLSSPDDGSSSLIYPGSAIKRVGTTVVPWDREDPSYRPPTYTAPEVIAGTNSDPGIVSLMRPGTVLFNELDKNFTPPVDRRSHLGEYEVVNSVPLCPLGQFAPMGTASQLRVILRSAPDPNPFVRTHG